MDLKKLFPWLLVAALIVAGATGCKAGELTAIKLVPQGANGAPANGILMISDAICAKCRVTVNCSFPFYELY